MSEVLLYLKKQPVPVNADAVSDELRMARNNVRRRLEELEGAGLVSSAGDPRRWKLDPGTKELERDLHDLFAAHAKDRFNVINLVASRNLERLRSLADAFRLTGKS